MNPNEEPSLKPSKITSVTEYKLTKRIPAQHTIRTIWTKESKHIEKSSQENLRKYNKQAHTMEPQSIRVLKEDRIEAVVAADPEAASEAADITPLYEIKINIYAVQLETTFSVMVRKGQHTICG